MYKSGEFVAQYINDGDLRDEQIQPNGVDLTVGELYGLHGEATLVDGDGYIKTPRQVMETADEEYYRSNSDELVETSLYKVPPGAYVIEYGEIIEIPENHVGFVYPRSRVMRCGAWLSTAVWDSGYRGKGEGGLLTFSDLKIEEDMRIAQIVFAETTQLEQEYSGFHQGENLE